ncbi:MAG: toll/interleukin-1 receptor domain-containing protein [Candidatus Competibacteraceae bacterium]
MTRDQIFISYSHADSAWLEYLQKALAPLHTQGNLKTWVDKDIKPGQRWQEEIKNALERAKIAVLLVSQDFLASEFITQNELPPLLNAAEKEGLTIFWIPVGASLYSETEINRYQAAYDPKTPLNKLRKAERQDAMLQIARKLMAILESASQPKTDEIKEPEINKIKEHITINSYQHGTGWTLIVDTPSGILWYNSQTGSGEFEQIDNAGNRTLINSYPAGFFYTNWTNVVNTPDGILWYNSQTGSGEIGQIDDAGNYTTIKLYAAGSFSSGWTNVINTPNGILWYNSRTGSGAFGRIGRIIF